MKYSNYDDYENLPLEEAKAELKSCFDSNGDPIDGEKISKLLRNKSLVEEVFSEENIIRSAKQEENPILRGGSEVMLNKVFVYPDNYWEMPDYYYPGLISTKSTHTMDSFPELLPSSKVKVTTTRNDYVLEQFGWKRKEWDSLQYFNESFPDIVLEFVKDTESVTLFKINTDTGKPESQLTFPFGLICGIFLKCRELEFSKPEELEKAFDPNKLFI